MESNQSLKKNLNEVSPMLDKGGEIFILLSPQNSGNEKMIMGYGVTPAGQVVKEHRHPYSEECFFVIDGEGEIVFENRETISFKKNDAVRVPQNVLHYIANTGAVALKVVFASGPLATAMKDGHINGGNDEKNNG